MTIIKKSNNQREIRKALLKRKMLKLPRLKNRSMSFKQRKSNFSKNIKKCQMKLKLRKNNSKMKQKSKNCKV